MSDLRTSGRTILFVSHNMSAIHRLCDRAVLLDKGRLVSAGPTGAVVRVYLESGLATTGVRRWEDEATAPGDEVVRLRSIRLAGPSADSDEVATSDSVDIEIEYWTAGTLRPAANIHVNNSEGICVFAVSDFGSSGWAALPKAPGVVRSTCTIPGNLLNEGRFSVSVAVDTYGPYIGRAGEVDAISFQVVDRNPLGTVAGAYTGEWPGVVRPILDWRVEWEAVK
jgi:lipopolysaccharide transport system ATP-binding protein